MGNTKFFWETPDTDSEAHIPQINDNVLLSNKADITSGIDISFNPHFGQLAEDLNAKISNVPDNSNRLLSDKYRKECRSITIDCLPSLLESTIVSMYSSFKTDYMDGMFSVTRFSENRMTENNIRKMLHLYGKIQKSVSTITSTKSQRIRNERMSDPLETLSELSLASNLTTHLLELRKIYKDVIGVELYLEFQFHNTIQERDVMYINKYFFGIFKFSISTYINGLLEVCGVLLPDSDIQYKANYYPSREISKYIVKNKYNEDEDEDEIGDDHEVDY